MVQASKTTCRPGFSFLFLRQLPLVISCTAKAHFSAGPLVSGSVQ